MSRRDFEEADHRFRHRVGLVVAFLVVALLGVVAVVLAVRALLPGGDRVSLSLYDGDSPGSISAQVQYTCDGGACGPGGDRLFFVVSGGGVETPTHARVGATEINEAMVREQQGGLVVHYGIPEGEPGYSTIDFPCASPGEVVQVEAIVESDGGESRATSSGSIECPAK